MENASSGVGTRWANNIDRIPERGRDTGRVPGEDVAVAAGVVADDDAALSRSWIGAQEVLGEPPCGTPNHHPVHPHRPGAERAAQTRGAELQPAGEAIRQAVFVVGGDELLELGSGLGVRIHRDPGLGALHAVRESWRHSVRPPHDRAGRDRVGYRAMRRRSSTRGRGPTWAMTSAAATAPKRPHSHSSWPWV